MTTVSTAEFLTLLLLGLAAYRLTRLVVVDTILGDWGDDEDYGTGLRGLVDRVLLRRTDHGRGLLEPRNRLCAWASELLACTWCAGVWVSAAVVVAWYHGGAVVEWVVAISAVAAIQGYLNSRANA